jgi:hypothetical protein
MDDVVEQVLRESEGRAARLASEGRAGVRPADGGTTEAFADGQVRWAFWQLANKDGTEYGRRQSDDARMVDVLASVISRTRSDERERAGQRIAAALKTLFGDDASWLVFDVADAMGLFDE